MTVGAARWIAGCVGLLLAAPGCGAKTGLLAPERALDVAEMDAPLDAPDAPDARDAPRACMPGRFTLIPRAADVLLVVDRSGSMSSGLMGDTRPPAGTPSRWGLLGSALRATLPMFADRIDVGALFYPQAGAGSSATCALPAIPSVDIEPAPDNASRVLGAISATGPGGSTPTAAALQRAYSWFVRHPNRARASYLVLTTDGAPNCNPALDPNTCVCTAGTGRCGALGGANGCLDDARTVDIIRQIATNPATAVPTYVIGIAPDADTTRTLTTTLTRMAVAGGRPKILPDGTRTFYSVRQAGDLAAALTEIQASIARCAFVTPSRPDDPDGMTLEIDGAPLPRDPTRTNGWDWTQPSFGEVTLFGAACTRAEAGTSTLTATVGCRDAGG